jgi:hypothetical protein
LHACRSTLEDPPGSNHRLQIFNPDGSYYGGFGGYGSGNYQFDAPAGIAIDHTGKVYIAEGTELEFVIMVIAVSCVKLLSAHNSTQHTSRKHKV